MMRNTAIAWAGEVIAKGASLAFFAVMARVLGEGGFGDFVFALSLSSLLVLAAGLGTDSLLEREVARDPSRARDYVSSITGLKATTSVVLLGAVAVAVTVADYPWDARLAFYLIGAGVVLEHLSKTRYSAFVAFERMKHMSQSIVVQRILTALVGTVLLLLGAGLVTASAVYLGGAVVGLAVAERSFRRMTTSGQAPVRRPLPWGRLLHAGLPIGIASLLFTLLLKFDTVLLGLLVGGTDNSEVGYFGAAYRIVEATMFLVWYIGGAVMPWVARADDGVPGHVARGYEVGLKAVTALLLPLAVGFGVLAGPLVRLLYGAGYEPAVLPLQLLSAMTVLYGINYMTSTFFVGRDRPGAFGWLLVGVVIQNVVFNLVLIPRYGAVGAAFNAALSGLVLALLGFRRARGVLGRVRLLRALASPLVAGAAMAGAMVVSAWVPLVSIVLGAVVYVLVLALVERVAFPEDFSRWRTAARRSRAAT
ncbi:flippase [Geodermatophilus sp. SYSU D00684]